LNIVEILVNDSSLRETLIENYLKKMPDFQKIEWKFIKNKANLQVIPKQEKLDIILVIFNK
jgi:DNA mismatch repair ATPase MutS